MYLLLIIFIAILRTKTLIDIWQFYWIIQVVVSGAYVSLSNSYAAKTASQKFQQINSVSLYNKIILANNK